MIFITVGSQKFQFDRLLKKVDELIEKQIITQKVFAQSGYSQYTPQNYESKEFVDRADFVSYMKEAELIITHAGTGAIMTGIKAGKKVIAVPRLASYGEHVDDHQIQILKEFEAMNIIEVCYELDDLAEVISLSNNKVYEQYTSSTKKIIDSIDVFIND